MVSWSGKIPLRSIIQCDILMWSRVFCSAFLYLDGKVKAIGAGK